MIVKICGVTHPDDARYAAELGADYIGMVLSTLSRRGISSSLAKEVAAAARSAGAEPIAVFVDEGIEEIEAVCRMADIRTIQLHGRGSKMALPLLHERYRVIYAIAVAPDGRYELPPLPAAVTPLFDSSCGGSGKIFDWTTFTPPSDVTWTLAGGINSANVALAIETLQPHAVSVCSGVEAAGTTRKDFALLRSFIYQAKKGSIKA